MSRALAGVDAHPQPPSGECPPEDALVRFAEGLAAPSERAALEEHLGWCHACAIAFAHAAHTGASEPHASDTTAPAVRRPGDRLGRYTVLGIVGSGGLGVVHATYDPQLDRRVAVKLVKDFAHDEGARQRLLDEARVLAKLSHPNVVQVYDAGIDHDGAVFVVMELVEGQTVAEWLRAEPRAWPAVRDVFLQAAAGLGAVHAVGLVHRDFKPSNAILDARGRVRVLDFGLARPVAAPTQEDPALAGDRAPHTRLAGTPAYMAPEQFRGEPIDHRADQFAFGVALYEALHGRRPFEGSELAALRQAVLAGARRPPPADSRAPAWLSAAVWRMLEPDRERRFASFDEVVRALEHDRRSRARGWWMGLGGIVAGLALATVVRVAYPPQPTDEERALIVELIASARSEAEARRFVYPEPEASPFTAFSRVRALEALEGPGRAAALAEAAALRSELATELRRLGERYWGDPGARGFAMDYYAMSLLFEPDERAAERAGLSATALQDLERRAAMLDFSGAELANARVLGALAAEEVDPTAFDAIERSPTPPSSMTLERARGAARARARPAAARTHASSPATAVAAARAPEPGPPDPSASATAAAAAAPSVAAPTPAVTLDPRSDRDPPTGPSDAAHRRALATKEIAAGRASYRALELDAAATHYHRAIGLDRQAHAASFGLAEVEFQRGHLSQAITHVQRALELSPGRASYLVLLGELYERASRYDEALATFEAAATKGSAAATKELERLRAKLGR